MRKTIQIPLPDQDDIDIMLPCGCGIFYYAALPAPILSKCADHKQTPYRKTVSARHEIGYYMRQFRNEKGKGYFDISMGEFDLWMLERAKSEYAAHLEIEKRNAEKLKAKIDKTEGKGL